MSKADSPVPDSRVDMEMPGVGKIGTPMDQFPGEAVIE